MGTVKMATVPTRTTDGATFWIGQCADAPETQVRATGLIGYRPTTTGLRGSSDSS